MNIVDTCFNNSGVGDASEQAALVWAKEGEGDGAEAATERFDGGMTASDEDSDGALRDLVEAVSQLIQSGIELRILFLGREDGLVRARPAS